MDVLGLSRLYKGRPGTRLKNQLEVAECLASEAMEPLEEILVEDE